MITIKGWPSFEAWRNAGYPGAKSFPLEEERPFPECKETACDRPATRHRGYCNSHYERWRIASLEKYTA